MFEWTFSIGQNTEKLEGCFDPASENCCVLMKNIRYEACGVLPKDLLWRLWRTGKGRFDPLCPELTLREQERRD